MCHLMGPGITRWLYYYEFHEAHAVEACRSQRLERGGKILFFVTLHAPLSTSPKLRGARIQGLPSSIWIPSRECLGISGMVSIVMNIEEILIKRTP